jgi:NAD(P)-dependent dehydrogenase (short-subunit alcohol dehydrogenase family)
VEGAWGVRGTGSRFDQVPAISFDDLQSNRSYNALKAYGQSKLANLMFTYELARRLRLKEAPTIAVAAHPGGSNTEILRNFRT